MAVFRLAWLVCDRCEVHCDDAHNSETVADARKSAKDGGWRMRPGEDICTDCLKDLALDAAEPEIPILGVTKKKLTQNMLAEIRRIAVTGGSARPTANGWVTKALVNRNLVEVDHNLGRIFLTTLGHFAARSDGDPTEYEAAFVAAQPPKKTST